MLRQMRQKNSFPFSQSSFLEMKFENENKIPTVYSYQIILLFLDVTIYTIHVCCSSLLLIMYDQLIKLLIVSK